MHFSEGAAHDCEVLSEYEHLAAVYAAVPGDDPLARKLSLVHAQIMTPVFDEHVEFGKASRIQ